MNETMIGGPILTNWLAIVGVMSLMYWGWRIVAAIQNRSRTSTSEAPVSSPSSAPAAAARSAPESGGPPEDIVVIAAAVHAMMGAHRIVHLESTQTGQTWAAEGRWMHQTSHRPG
jgi:threonine/homoserine/homoserine lactone efflux protein